MDAPPEIKLNINGKDFIISDSSLFEESLLDFIRDRLSYKDVKCGCNKGFCGSCTVVVNGTNKKSCLLKLKTLNGAIIKTPSAINSPALSKISERLHRHGAVQCGFCFPGIACSLEAKLKDKSNFSRKDVLDALSGHICRCTGYEPIIKSVMDENIASGFSSENKCNSVGKSPVRQDSEIKLNGSALYADDIELPGMLHVFVLRALHARAKIKSIDTFQAEKAEGVVKIITHKDLPGAKKFGIMRHDQPVLCSDSVMFKGDAVAIVTAESRRLAAAAAALIKVEYERLPAIYNLYDALKPEAPKLYDEGNVFCDIELLSKNPVDKYLSSSNEYVCASAKFFMGPVEHAYMEPECSVASFDTQANKLTLYAGSQNIHSEKLELAEILGLQPECVAIELAYTGGGFGGKEDLTTQPYSAIASLLTGRPCKYRMEREESILCSTKKHPFDIEITISADKSGILAGIDVKALSDIGAYASLSRIVITRFATHVLGPYTWKAYRISAKGVHTNNLIAGAMRGFGVNQACFAIESMIDRLAENLRISPCELRRKNMIADQKIMGLGEIATNSSGLLKSFEAATAQIDFNSIACFNQNSSHIKRGASVAIAYKNMGLGNNSPRDVSMIRISAAPGLKKLTLHTSASDIGQGIYNILRQIAAEEAGLGLEYIEVDWGKTETAPPAGVTSASRQTFMSGNAARRAIVEFYSTLAKDIEKRYNTEPNSISIERAVIIYKAGRPDEAACDIWEYISQYFTEGFEITCQYDAPKTSELEKAGVNDFKSHFGYSYAAHAVIVEADTKARTYKILKIIAAHDAGFALNPVSLYGQIIGGVVMGLGYAVSENLKVENGGPDKRGLAGMGLFKAKDVPDIIPIVIESAHPEGPFGARGIGEISTVPVAAALANALRAATGLNFDTLPFNHNINAYKYIAP